MCFAAFSSPEPPFLLVTWSEKRHFKTSSTGDENGFAANNYLLLRNFNHVLVWKKADRFPELSNDKTIIKLGYRKIS